MKSPSMEGLLKTAQHFNDVCGVLFNRLKIPNAIHPHADVVSQCWKHAVQCMHEVARRELQNHFISLVTKYGNHKVPQGELDKFNKSRAAQKASYLRWLTEVERELQK
jgi:hypothetical protein